jgi:phosphoglycerate kinase
MSKLRTLSDLDLRGKTVLVRADLNAPLDGGVVTDDFRLEASLPTIAAIRAAGGRVIVCSHLGRPKGPDPAFSMRPVGERLGELGGFEVRVATDVAGPDSERLVAEDTDAVLVLENTRFESGETTNEPALAARLAALADVFVLDAFGSAHRAHASTAGVAEILPSAIGLLLEAELEAFERVLTTPARPFVVVLGGAKVSDKLGVIESLLPKVDVMLIGGAMCFTILAADGFEVGDSLVEPDMYDEVRDVLSSEYGGRISLPVDIVVAERFASDSPYEVHPARDLPAHGMGLDIGPETAERYAAVLAGADTIFWNGPMGVAEWKSFGSGTRAVAEAVTASPAYSVAGGGDSVAALRRLGLHDRVSHLSTGGGAGLELIEDGSLVAVEAVRRSRDT